MAQQPELHQRLAGVLAAVLAVTEEPDGALTLRHGGTLASARVVGITADLELVSLTQVLAWDLPATRKLREMVAERAGRTLLGSVTLVQKAPEPAAKKTADVLLRYNFPGTGLTDEALQTLVLMVLDHGAEIRRDLLD